MSELLFETDWLGSRPVFYNECTGAASRDINDVIAFAEAEFDPEGLAGYLAAGYSVFGHTPLRGVRFLSPSARLWRDDDGRLRVEDVPLDLEDRLARRRSEDEIVDLLREHVRAAESSAAGELVIPTSGGYDSRLLNLMVAEPAKVRSFTFGATPRQWDALEVARAARLAELLGTSWERVHLGPFHGHLDAWDDVFGPAVHAHGMYQMEFYRRVAQRTGGGKLVLSGLGGDWFEGQGDWMIADPVKGPGDLHQLVLTKRMHADPGAAVIPSTGSLAEEYYESHRDILSYPLGCLVEATRIRFALTQYLLRVPELYGFVVDAPFLDYDLATAMLALPGESRHDRRWVTEYLATRGALLGDVRGETRYWLYWPAMRRQPLAPLDERLLAEIVRPDYVRWINRTVGWQGLWYEGYERLGRRPGLRRAAGYLRARGLRQRRLEAYHAYMTLRPLQRLLQKRDAARGGRLETEAAAANTQPSGEPMALAS